MAKQIIILGSAKDWLGNTSVNYCFWIPVAAGREVPKPGATSAFRGATAPEVALIASGAVIEVVNTEAYVPSKTLAAIKSDLIERYTQAAAAVAALPSPNQFFGVAYDGSVWT